MTMTFEYVLGVFGTTVSGNGTAVR